METNTPFAGPVSGRRRVLTGLGAAPLVVLASPAIAQGRPRLRIGLAVEAGSGMEMADGLAARLAVMSDGALTLELIDGGALGQVIAGDLDGLIGSGADWIDIDPGFGLFAACPLGLSPGEFAGWVHQGGGQAVWDGLGANYGLKPLLAGDAGARPAGWFDRPPGVAADFQGRPMATFGLGAVAVAALGGVAVADPTAARGACSSGVSADLAAGFDTVFPTLATPALWQPQSALTLALSAGVWATLDPVHQAMIEAATRAEGEAMTGRALALDLEAIARAVTLGVRIAPLDQMLYADIAIPVFEALSDTMVASAQPFLWDDYRAFLAEVARWSAIGEGAFSVARANALGI